MKEQFLMGIDIGTYESKGVISTTDGRVVAYAAVGHELSTPKPGWGEHDAEKIWWQDFVHLSRKLLLESDIDANQIAGLGVSAIAPCVLPIDEQGRPLRPAILYGLDTRASDEIMELEKILGREAIFENSALHLSSQAAGPKILWIRKNEPEIWKKTSSILTSSGYLVYKLTGKKVIDFYTATAYAPLLDIKNKTWSEEMAAPITPLERLPRLMWSNQVAGKVTSEAARQTGLAPGTPVVAGTADAATEALSAGLSEAGDLMVMYGSSIFFIQKTDKLVLTDELWGAVFLEEQTYAVAAGMSTSGSLTRWFRDQLSPLELQNEKRDGINAYAALADLAKNSKPGANGVVVLPYFSGERTPINDPYARGLFFGLSLSTTRADLYRAILEGVGFGIRHNIDTMRKKDVPPKRILAVGGGTKNHLWLQIVSDIAGINQYVPDQHYGASYGDAFLAGVGVGIFSDTSQIVDWIDYSRVVVHDPQLHELYQPYYDIYRQLYMDTADSMKALVRLENA